MPKIHDGLKHWTPDEVAECLDGVSMPTYGRLWELTSELEKAGKAVPIGGDGSDGTIECPPEPDAYTSGKMPAIWNKLTEEQQVELNNCMQKRETDRF